MEGSSELERSQEWKAHCGCPNFGIDTISNSDHSSMKLAIKALVAVGRAGATLAL